MTKNYVCQTPYHITFHMIVFLWHKFKMMTCLDAFFIFSKFFSFFQNLDFSGFWKFINKCQKEILGCDLPSSHVCDFYWLTSTIFPMNSCFSSSSIKCQTEILRCVPPFSRVWFFKINRKFLFTRNSDPSQISSLSRRSSSSLITSS